METYNGWTNNATWRVNVDILGDIEFKKPITTNDLKEIVEERVFRGENNLAEDYARAFLSEVNYNEIAELINEEL